MVVASAQTAGRGRLGARWHSPPDAGLYVSLVIRPRRRVRAVPDAGGRRRGRRGHHARDRPAGPDQVAERHHRRRQRRGRRSAASSPASWPKRRPERPASSTSCWASGSTCGRRRILPELAIGRPRSKRKLGRAVDRVVGARRNAGGARAHGLASNREGSSTALLEAWRASRPVVARNGAVEFETPCGRRRRRSPPASTTGERCWCGWAAGRAGDRG